MAAAPLWIFCAWSILKRQWLTAARTFAAAVAATAVWVWLQLWLMLSFNYSYGGSKSTDLLHGGDFVVWYGHMGPRGAAVAIFTAFGALFLLMPIGFARASRDLRLLAIAALPAALVLSYVQQPDRALWNFHYVLIPFAVIALEPLPAVWRWAFIVCYGAANLRVGAQLQFIPAARFALLASVLIALAAIVAALRRPRGRKTTPPPAPDSAAPWSNRSVAWVFAAEAAAVILAVLLILDIRAHAAVEQENGPNTRGYRQTPGSQPPAAPDSRLSAAARPMRPASTGRTRGRTILSVTLTRPGAKIFQAHRLRWSISRRSETAPAHTSRRSRITRT